MQTLVKTKQVKNVSLFANKVSSETEGAASEYKVEIFLPLSGVKVATVTVKRDGRNSFNYDVKRHDSIEDESAWNLSNTQFIVVACDLIGQLN